MKVEDAHFQFSIEPDDDSFPLHSAADRVPFLTKERRDAIVRRADAHRAKAERKGEAVKIRDGMRACTWEESFKDEVPGCEPSGLCCTEDGATFFASPDATNVTWLCIVDNTRLIAKLGGDRQRMKRALQAIVENGDAVSSETAESALKGLPC